MPAIEETPCVSSDYSLKRKWYNHHFFSLTPQLEIRKENKYNTSGFTFRWLMLTIWAMDAPGCEAAIVCDTHWGIGVTFSIFYLRIIFCIPCPDYIGVWSQRNLWRKPKNRHTMD